MPQRWSGWRHRGNYEGSVAGSKICPRPGQTCYVARQGKKPMKLIKFFSVLLTVAACSAAEQITSGGETKRLSEDHTNAFKWSPLSPGPDDGKIAYVAAKVLEGNHYLQRPIDDAISSKFLDKYLNALDPAHLLFFQSDLAEFEKWRTKL